MLLGGFPVEEASGLGVFSGIRPVACGAIYFAGSVCG